MWILHILIFNLTIVFVVELTLAVILGARNFKKFITVALINIITNPLVVITMLTVTMFYNRFETFVLVVLELAVFFTEGFLFSKYKSTGCKVSGNFILFISCSKITSFPIVFIVCFLSL